MPEANQPHDRVGEHIQYVCVRQRRRVCNRPEEVEDRVRFRWYARVSRPIEINDDGDLSVMNRLPVGSLLGGPTLIELLCEISKTSMRYAWPPMGIVRV